MEGYSTGTSREDTSLIAPLLPPASTPAESSGLIDYAQLATAQKDCPDIERLLKDSSLHTKEFQTEGGSLFCDVSMGWSSLWFSRGVGGLSLRPCTPLLIRAFGLLEGWCQIDLFGPAWQQMASWCCCCQPCIWGKVH